MRSKENWLQFWSNRKASSGDENISDADLMIQVGKTIGGLPIDMTHVEQSIKSILQNLCLKETDKILDAGCGNGLLTEMVAEYCDSISGIDFSTTLIETAKQASRRDVAYYCGDISSPESYLNVDPSINKIYSFEVFQHLSEGDCHNFLKLVHKKFPALNRVFLGGLPDKEKIRNFYNTDERWLDYLNRLKNDSEAIGHWWSRERLMKIAEKEGFECVIQDQNENFYTTHYRFDAVLVKR